MAAATMTQALELREISSDTYVNTHRPWLPRGARGIFGGVFVAQALVAASRTVAPGVLVRSMHCTFIMPGDPDVPFTYHVTRLDSTDHSGFVRQVVTRQGGQTVFLALVRLGEMEAEPKKSEVARKTVPGDLAIEDSEVVSGGNSPDCPYVCTRIDGPDLSQSPHQRRTVQWAKTRDILKRDPDSSEGHAAALAYITDNYFLCTAPRVYDLVNSLDPEHELDPPRIGENTKTSIGMMMSLDHSIYFHEPSTRYRADDWMLVEMECPWSGDGRALVLQRVYSKDGVLVATVVQEGMFRTQPSDSKL